MTPCFTSSCSTPRTRARLCYEKHRQEGTLLPESVMPPADSHGQYRFNYRHPHIHGGMEEQFLLDAFRRDFDVNGPSLYRIIRTMLEGWKAHGLPPRLPHPETLRVGRGPAAVGLCRGRVGHENDGTVETGRWRRKWGIS